MSELDQTNQLSQAPQPQDVIQQQNQLQAPLISTPPQQPVVNAASENLQCQWQGCAERCPSAEALYEHVCERHVGRKSTNNLNLTCAWGQCRTTTVKRDHITSHIRVHVPLKPHKCEFCGKAFKRPQDLKKHVKTHADDSVIMRSPEPNGARQPQGGMPQGGDYNTSYYGQHLTGQAPQNYYAPAMPPQDYASQHHANQYYQPQAGQHPGYGPVTYYGAPAPQTTYDYETRKRTYDALDQFFGQVKRREFDPVNFHNVSRRLYELQGLQLPQIIPSSMNVPAYQPVSAMGGGYADADPIQAYSLPPMGNAKTRGDLTSIDQILEQMQATIYENDATHFTQTGTSQPNTNYVAYRTSNSPPNAALPSTAAHSNPVSLLHQHNPSIASASDASTPGLTPPSSAQSYTSGQSPLTGHAAPNTSAMYPSLPSSADMAYAAANAATLSGLDYGDESRRHYTGGQLRRAAPAKDTDEVMEGVRDGSTTPPAAAINKAAKGKKKASPKDSVIDPALSGEASTPKSEDKAEQDREQIWVQNMRLIEWMRDFIKKRLERGEFDSEQEKAEVKVEGPADTEMGDAEEDSIKKDSDADALYPVLQHVNEESA